MTKNLKKPCAYEGAFRNHGSKECELQFCANVSSRYFKKPTCAHRFYCFEVQYTCTTSHKMRSNHVPMLALATKVNTKLQNNAHNKQ